MLAMLKFNIGSIIVKNLYLMIKEVGASLRTVVDKVKILKIRLIA